MPNAAGANAASRDGGPETRGHATRVVSTCFRATIRPHNLIVTCADGGFIMHHLHYGHWGKYRAYGQGMAKTNDCDPSCADGHFESHRVKFWFDRTKVVHGQRLFVHARMTYLHHKPSASPWTRHFALPR